MSVCRFMHGIAALGVVLVVGHARADVIGLTGPFAPATWSVSSTGTVTGSSGSAIETATSVVLTGGNDPSGSRANGDIACSLGLDDCEIRFTHPVVSGFNAFSFHWVYVSADASGAQYDPFGIILDGVHATLSNPGGPASQSGDEILNLMGVSAFGLFVNCGDCVGGAASVTLSNIVSSAAVPTVPEPATLALLGIGVAGLAASRRRN